MANQTKVVYLDYNATTPLDPEVLEAITHSLKNDWANPNSGYAAGESVQEQAMRWISRYKFLRRATGQAVDHQGTCSSGENDRLQSIW